jgi:CelD/BcsL family acetyltransferase involved in cellulose biosynthesis
MEKDAVTAITVDVVRGLDRLAAEQEQWSRLFRARAHEPSVSFEWTRAMVAHHVRPDDQCLLMRLHRRGVLVGLIPLVIRTVPLLGWRIRMLTPLSEDYNTHSDLLLRDPAPDVIHAFVTALLECQVQWDCWRMGRLVEGGALALGLEGALAATGLPHVLRDGVPAYTLSLPETYGQYLADRSSKFRNHLRRVERRIEGAGAVDVRYAVTPSSLAAGFAALLAIEEQSWKHEHGSAITTVARQMGFYRELCLEALEAGHLHLQWLEIDGRPAAYNLGYLAAGRYHYLKTSYDSGLRALGPATYLRARLVAQLIADGVDILDFPGEPYQWETQWTHELRWHRILSVYRPTARGRSLAAIERWRHRWRGRRIEHVEPRRVRSDQNELQGVVQWLTTWRPRGRRKPQTDPCRAASDSKP